MTDPTTKVEIATAGIIDRHDKCVVCNGPMVYRVTPGTEIVEASYCGAWKCPAFVNEIPE